jgi:hypothetical protein
MDNQLVINHETLQTRNIDTITVEIINLKNQAKTTFLAYACEIGKRLCEAKNKLNHGEWGAWLKEKVDFSQSTANNYMNLYVEYGDGSALLLGAGANSQAFANLDYSKAIMLLAIPAEERESFVTENDIEHKSSRETDKLVKDYKTALEEKKKLEEENARLAGYQKEASDNMIKALTAQRKLTEKERELEKVKAELEAARHSEPVEESPALSDEELDQIKADAKHEAEEQFKAELKAREDALKNEIAAEKAKKEAAEARAKEANDKIAEYEKQAKMSNPFVAEFKLVFEDFQSKADVLLSIIASAKRDDPETAAKLRKALDAALSKIS